MARVWWAWPLIGVFGVVLVHRLVAHQSWTLPALMIVLLVWFVVRAMRKAAR